jgi:hypothetical protein
MLHTYKILEAQISALLEFGPKPRLDQEIPVQLAAEVRDELFQKHEFEDFRSSVQQMMAADGNDQLEYVLMRTLLVDRQSMIEYLQDRYGEAQYQRKWRWQFEEDPKTIKKFDDAEQLFRDAFYIMYYLLREQIRRSRQA